LGSLRRQLEELKIRPRKRWGQHFVRDPHILRKIVEEASPEKEDIVLEIGAGLGGLTAALAQRVKRVYALEIDPKLVEALRGRFSGIGEIEVIQADALQFDFARILRPWRKKIKVVANLPYEISTPMIFRLLKEREFFSLLVLMLQLEVAKKVVAKPGTKDYGPLSLWSQLYSRSRIAFQVGPGAFHPPPKVSSAVVRFEILPQSSIKVEDEKNLEEVIRAAFAYRRKTLGKSLQMSGFSSPEIQRALEACGLSPQARGETLTLEQFAILARFIRPKEQGRLTAENKEKN